VEQYIWIVHGVILERRASVSNPLNLVNFIAEINKISKSFEEV
jgi:hypothetical protein